MSEYGISQIYPTDRYSNDQVDKLLLAEGAGMETLITHAACTMTT